MSGKVGVLVFVLRRTAAREMEMLLIQHGPAQGETAPRWAPLGGAIAPTGREADAALQELQRQTTLEPVRLYAAPFSVSNDDEDIGPIGHTGVFVGFVSADAEVSTGEGGRAFAWCLARDAEDHLAASAHRAAARRVRSEFVRTSPDEALRVV